jgi:hypothetical protein
MGNSTNSFQAIVSQQQFDAVQQKLSERVREKSNEKLLQELQASIKRHGSATYAMLAADPAMPDALT